MAAKTKGKIRIELAIQYKGERAREIIAAGKGERDFDSAAYVNELSKDLLALGLPQNISTPSEVDIKWGNGAATCIWILRKNSPHRTSIRNLAGYLRLHGQDSELLRRHLISSVHTYREDGITIAPLPAPTNFALPPLSPGITLRWEISDLDQNGTSSPPNGQTPQFSVDDSVPTGSKRKGSTEAAPSKRSKLNERDMESEAVRISARSQDVAMGGEKGPVVANISNPPIASSSKLPQATVEEDLISGNGVMPDESALLFDLRSQLSESAQQRKLLTAQCSELKQKLNDQDYLRQLLRARESELEQWKERFIGPGARINTGVLGGQVVEQLVKRMQDLGELNRTQAKKDEVLRACLQQTINERDKHYSELKAKYESEVWSKHQMVKGTIHLKDLLATERHRRKKLQELLAAKQDQPHGIKPDESDSPRAQANQTSKTVEAVEAGWAAKYNDLKRRLYQERSLLESELKLEKDSNARLSERLDQRSRESSDLGEKLQAVSKERDALAAQLAQEKADRRQLEDQLDQQAKVFIRLSQDSNVSNGLQERLDREIKERIEAEEMVDEQRKAIIRLTEQLHLAADERTEMEMQLQSERDAHMRSLRQLDNEKGEREKLSEALLREQNERSHVEQALREKLLEHEAELSDIRQRHGDETRTLRQSLEHLQQEKERLETQSAWEKTMLERERATVHEVVAQQAQAIAQSNNGVEYHTPHSTVSVGEDAFALEQERLLKKIEAGRVARAALELISSSSSKRDQHGQEIQREFLSARLRDNRSRRYTLTSEADLNVQLQDSGLDLGVLLQLGSSNSTQNELEQGSDLAGSDLHPTTSAQTRENEPSSNSIFAEKSSHANYTGVSLAQSIFPAWAQPVSQPGSSV